MRIFSWLPLLTLTLLFLWPPSTHGDGWILMALVLFLSVLSPDQNRLIPLGSLVLIWYAAVNPGPWVIHGLYALTALASWPLFLKIKNSHRTRILALWVSLALIKAMFQVVAHKQIALNTTLPDSIRSFARAGRPMGPFHLPSHLAFATGIGLFLVWHGFSTEKKTSRLPWAFFGLACLWGLWVTSSFSALVWLLPAIGLAGLAKQETRQQAKHLLTKPGPTRWAILGSLAGVSTLLVAVIWRRQSRGISLLNSLSDHLHDLGVVKHLGQYWNAFGIGPGGLQTGLLNHSMVDPSFHQTRYLHNSWLQAGLEMGWIFGLAALIFFFSLARKKFSISRPLPVVAMISYFFLFNLTDFLAYQILPLLLFVGLISIEFEQHTEAKQKVKLKKSNFLPLPALMAFLFLSITCLWFAVQGLWWEKVFEESALALPKTPAPTLLLYGATKGLPILPPCAIYLVPTAVTNLAADTPDTLLFDRLRVHPDPGVRHALASALRERGLRDQALRLEQKWRP